MLLTSHALAAHDCVQLEIGWKEGKHFTLKDMAAQSTTCLGHKEREDRKNKIVKLTIKPKEDPDEDCRILIKKGPVSVETSLKDLEDIYEKKPEWKLIEDGGVLSIPVEELRMENPPRPDRSGQVVFKEKKGGGGKQIDNYLVVQTIDYLNALILEKYEEEKKRRWTSD